MTWRGERRKQLPPDWAGRRRARLELDGYRCTYVHTPTEPFDFALVARLRAEGDNLAAQRHVLASLSGRCTARATDVHHALDANDHRIEALRSLCAWHHQQHTQAEAQAARGVGPTRLRPKAKHPGLR